MARKEKQKENGETPATPPLDPPQKTKTPPPSTTANIRAGLGSCSITDVGQEDKDNELAKRADLKSDHTKKRDLSANCNVEPGSSLGPRRKSPEELPARKGALAPLKTPQANTSRTTTRTRPHSPTTPPRHRSSQGSSPPTHQSPKNPRPSRRPPGTPSPPRSRRPPAPKTPKTPSPQRYKLPNTPANRKRRAEALARTPGAEQGGSASPAQKRQASRQEANKPSPSRKLVPDGTSQTRPSTRSSIINRNQGYETSCFRPGQPGRPPPVSSEKIGQSETARPTRPTSPKIPNPEKRPAVSPLLAPQTGPEGRAHSELPRPHTQRPCARPEPSLSPHVLQPQSLPEEETNLDWERQLATFQGPPHPPASSPRPRREPREHNPFYSRGWMPGPTKYNVTLLHSPQAGQRSGHHEGGHGSPTGTRQEDRRHFSASQRGRGSTGHRGTFRGHSYRGRGGREQITPRGDHYDGRLDSDGRR